MRFPRSRTAHEIIEERKKKAQKNIDPAFKRSASEIIESRRNDPAFARSSGEIKRSRGWEGTTRQEAQMLSDAMIGDIRDSKPHLPLAQIEQRRKEEEERLTSSTASSGIDEIMEDHEKRKKEREESPSIRERLSSGAETARETVSEGLGDLRDRIQGFERSEPTPRGSRGQEHERQQYERPERDISESVDAIREGVGNIRDRFRDPEDEVDVVAGREPRAQRQEDRPEIDIYSRGEGVHQKEAQRFPEGEGDQIFSYTPTPWEAVKEGAGKLGDLAQIGVQHFAQSFGGRSLNRIVDGAIERQLKDSPQRLEYFKSDREYWTEERILNHSLNRRSDTELSTAEKAARGIGEFSGSVAQLVGMSKALAPLSGLAPNGPMVSKLIPRVATGGLSFGETAFQHGGDAEDVITSALKGSVFYGAGGAASDVSGKALNKLLTPVYHNFPQWGNLLRVTQDVGSSTARGLAGGGASAAIDKATGEDVNVNDVLATGLIMGAAGFLLGGMGTKKFVPARPKHFGDTGVLQSRMKAYQDALRRTKDPKDIESIVKGMNKAIEEEVRLVKSSPMKAYKQQDQTYIKELRDIQAKMVGTLDAFDAMAKHKQSYEGMARNVLGAGQKATAQPQKPAQKPQTEPKPTRSTSTEKKAPESPAVDTKAPSKPKVEPKPVTDRKPSTEQLEYTQAQKDTIQEVKDDEGDKVEFFRHQGNPAYKDVDGTYYSIDRNGFHQKMEEPPTGEHSQEYKHGVASMLANETKKGFRPELREELKDALKRGGYSDQAKADIADELYANVGAEETNKFLEEAGLSEFQLADSTDIDQAMGKQYEKMTGQPEAPGEVKIDKMKEAKSNLQNDIEDSLNKGALEFEGINYHTPEELAQDFAAREYKIDDALDESEVNQLIDHAKKVYEDLGIPTTKGGLPESPNKFTAIEDEETYSITNKQEEELLALSKRLADKKVSPEGLYIDTKNGAIKVEANVTNQGTSTFRTFRDGQKDSLGGFSKKGAKLVSTDKELAMTDEIQEIFSEAAEKASSFKVGDHIEASGRIDGYTVEGFRGFEDKEPVIEVTETSEDCQGNMCDITRTMKESELLEAKRMAEKKPREDVAKGTAKIYEENKELIDMADDHPTASEISDRIRYNLVNQQTRSGAKYTQNMLKADIAAIRKEMQKPKEKPKPKERELTQQEAKEKYQEEYVKPHQKVVKEISEKDPLETDLPYDLRIEPPRYGYDELAVSVDKEQFDKTKTPEGKKEFNKYVDEFDKNDLSMARKLPEGKEYMVPSLTASGMIVHNNKFHLVDKQSEEHSTARNLYNELTFGDLLVNMHKTQKDRMTEVDGRYYFRSGQKFNWAKTEEDVKRELREEREFKEKRKAEEEKEYKKLEKKVIQEQEAIPSLEESLEMEKEGKNRKTRIKNIEQNIRGKKGKIRKHKKAQSKLDMLTRQEKNQLKKEVKEQYEAEQESIGGLTPPGKGIDADKDTVRTGIKDTAAVSDGSEIEFEYAIVDSSLLVTSHSGKGLTVNKSYPQELQPRDRSRVASKDQIDKIKKNLNPKLLGGSPTVSDGAPVIGQDTIVESGNARAISINQLYQDGHENAEKYSDFVSDFAKKNNVKKKLPPNPTLVRVRLSDVDRADFVKKANEASIAAMSSTELAETDAERLDSYVLEKFIPSEAGKINTAANQPFITAFMEKVIPKNERPKYMTKDGMLSTEGLNRVKNAIFHKAYGEKLLMEKVGEDLDNNIRNVTNAMINVAPRIVDMKERIKSKDLYDVDFSRDIGKATLKFQNLKDTGVQVEEYLNQVSMIDELDNFQKEILNIIDKNNRSTKKLTDIFNKMIDGLEESGSPNQVSLLEQKQVDKPTLLEYALRRLENEQGAIRGQVAIFDTEPQVSTETPEKPEPTRPKESKAKQTAESLEADLNRYDEVSDIGSFTISTNYYSPEDSPPSYDINVTATSEKDATEILNLIEKELPDYDADFRSSRSPWINEHSDGKVEVGDNFTIADPNTDIVGETSEAKKEFMDAYKDIVKKHGLRKTKNFKHPEAKEIEEKYGSREALEQRVKEAKEMANPVIRENKEVEEFVNSRITEPGKAYHKNKDLSFYEHYYPLLNDVSIANIIKFEKQIEGARQEFDILTNDRQILKREKMNDRLKKKYGTEKNLINNHIEKRQQIKSMEEALKLAKEVNKSPYNSLSQFVRKEVPGEEIKSPEEASKSITDITKATKDDISKQKAIDAHSRTSHDPEKRGEQFRQDYVESVRGVEERIMAQADNPQKVEVAKKELERFKDGYLKRTIDALDAHSNIASTMVTGPAKFNVAKNEKANDRYMKKVNDLIEFKERAIKSMERKLAGKETKEEKVAKRVKEVEKVLDNIESIIVNEEPYNIGLFRSNFKDKLTRMADNGEFEAFDEAIKLTKERNDKLVNAGHKVIFAKNNSIWDYGQKAKMAQGEKPTGIHTVKEYPGDVAIKENYDADRLQITFPGIPSEEIRNDLKRSGFRWSGKNKAWQRKITPSARYKSEEILDKHYNVEKPKPEPQKKIEEEAEKHFNEDNKIPSHYKGTTPDSEKMGVLPKDFKPVPDNKKFTYEDEELERRRAENYIKKESVAEKVKSWRDEFSAFATRTFRQLDPKDPKNAEAIRLLTQYKKLPKISGDEASRIMMAMVKDDNYELSNEDFNRFSRLALLRDLNEELKKGNPLPGLYDGDNVPRELARLEASSNEWIKKSLDKRKELVQNVIDRYKPAMRNVGVHVGDIFNNEEYFRHQVLHYYNVNRMTGGSGGMSKVKINDQRGWTKHRAGTTLDINEDFLQVEYEVLSQMIYDIRLAEMLKEFDDHYNISKKLKADAKQLNEENLQGLIELEKTAPATIGQQSMTGETMYSETEDMLSQYNQNIAIGFSQLSDLAQRGQLWDGDGKFAKQVRDLYEEASSTHLLDDPIGDSSQLFTYLAALAEEDTAGSMAARMIFKGISNKKKLMQQKLGDKYATWEDLIPEGYRKWQPKPGRSYFRTQSVSENFAEAMIKGELKDLGMSDLKIREVLAVGPPNREYVIPENVANTLDDVYNKSIDTNNPIARAVAAPMRYWKGWVLTGNPRQVLKYFFRNTTGDMEGFFMSFGMKGVKEAKVLESIKELQDAINNNKFSPDMLDWLEMGGYQSLLYANEVADVGEVPIFKKYAQRKESLGHLPKNLLAGWFRATKNANNFREAILRYAGYKHALDQIKKNNGNPPFYGRSLKSYIDGLKDPKHKAYQLSKDAMGSYDDVTELTEFLSTFAIPFARFLDTNLKGYKRIMQNTLNDSAAVMKAGRKTAGLMGFTKASAYTTFKLGSMAIRLTFMYGATMAWNNLVMGEHEERLPQHIRNSPHIVFGTNDRGEILYFPRVGISNDVLEWFGMHTLREEIKEVQAERKEWSEVGRNRLIAPINKLANALNPAIVTPFELTFGRSIFPDIENPRSIRDPKYYLAQSLGVHTEYRHLTNLPVNEDYLQSWTRAFLYKTDPEVSAYYTVLDLKRKFELQELGKYPTWVMSEDPKGQDLYYFRQAVHYGDQDAMTHYLENYFDKGGTPDGIVGSLERMNPIYGFDDMELIQFIEWLNESEKEELRRALNYYSNLVLEE